MGAAANFDAKLISDNAFVRVLCFLGFDGNADKLI